MPPITSIPPTILRDRHRLSPQQINMLCGKRVIGESREEKAEALDRVAEFLRLTDALVAARTAFIPLKGPLLSERLYGDPTVRFSHDLDILVKTDDIENAARVFTASGYAQMPPPIPEDLRRREKLIKYSHHISFIHPDIGQIVELHWRIMNRPWIGFTDIDTLLSENLSEYEFAGRKFTTLSVELELLYLIIHGGAHHWGRLKWLADIHRLIEIKFFRESKFITLTERLKAGRLVALCNWALRDYMPSARQLPCKADAPAYMVSSVQQAIAGESYHGPETITEILSNMRYAFSAYQGLPYKLKLAGTVVSNSLLSGRLRRALD